MANLLTKDVAGTGFSPLEAVGTAVAKIVIESALSKVPFVGNGTLKSGAIKMGLATVSGMVMPKAYGLKNMVTTALVVDGAEDIVRGVFGSMLGGTDNSSSTVGGSSSNQGASSSMSI